MSRHLQTVLTVVRKELRDFYRDRKTFWMTLLMAPLMYPVIFLGLGALAEKRASTQLEKPLSIPVDGIQRAPTLVAYLRSRGIEAKPTSEAELTTQLLNQDADVGLIIDKDYAERWRAGKPAKIEIVRDSTRSDADLPFSRLQTALSGYSSTVGALRLVARGIDPQVAQAVNVATRDLATPEAKRSRFISAILPMILTLFAFIGSMHLAMDTTAGERERQSLEPLLATPASRGAVVTGKMLAAAIVGVATIVLILLSFKLSAALSTGQGKMLDVSFIAIVRMLLVLLPLALIGTALLTFLAAGAKSMKEAQANMVWLMFLPMLPSFALMGWPLKNTELWQYAVPFLSQNQLIQMITRSEAPSTAQWAVYLACALTLALVLWMAAVWRYRQEKLAISS